MQALAHDFAEREIRPVAADLDEREEFPWPVVEEAAKIGLYSLDFIATQVQANMGVTATAIDAVRPAAPYGYTYGTAASAPAAHPAANTPVQRQRSPGNRHAAARLPSATASAA